MAKRYPSELNTKTVRINIGDWVLLAEISRRADVTIAEALHLALERQEPEPEPERELEKVTKVSPVQISLEVFRVAAGVVPSRVTTRIMPSRVTGNGVAHIKPKIIREVS